MKRMERNTARGFTLIELLVVVSIIAILLGLLVPILGGFRNEANIAKVKAMFHGISLGLESYRQQYNVYPPDSHPALDKSSECLVYYLSGSTIVYVPGTSPATYPWQNPLYTDSTGQSGSGRRAIPWFYDEFEATALVDQDGDRAPEICDPWQRRIVYNSGNSADGAYNQFGAPHHRINSFDLICSGRDKVFGPAKNGVYDLTGTVDDVTNWGTAMPPGAEYTWPTFNSPNSP